MTYVVAITARPESMLHAISLPPRRYSRTGKTYVAACGAQVRTVYDGTPFDIHAGRACRECRKIAQ